MQLALSTDDPHLVMNYLQDHREDDFLAILDIDLASDLNGLDLATEFRQMNGFTEICFISVFEDMLLDIVNSNTEPIDFISKAKGVAEIDAQLRKVIDLTVVKYLKLVSSSNPGRMFSYEPFQGLIRRIPVDEILYIKTTGRQHKLELICKNRKIEFYGELKSIERRRRDFIRADRQILINPNNVESVDVKDRRIYFATDQVDLVSCKVSLRKITSIKKIFTE